MCCYYINLKRNTRLEYPAATNNNGSNTLEDVQDGVSLLICFYRLFFWSTSLLEQHYFRLDDSPCIAVKIRVEGGPIGGPKGRFGPDSKFALIGKPVATSS